MSAIFKWLGYLLVSIVFLCVVYLGSVLIGYPDIEVDDLNENYAIPGLKKATVDLQPVYYQDTGEGPAIVLIHSHFFTMQMWDEVVNELSGNYRIIRYDLTSHGLTGPQVNDDYSMQADVALLHGLIKHLNLEKVTLVGSSLGGNIAINYLSAHPASVEALVLQNSGGFRKADSRGGRGDSLPGWANYLLYLFPKAGFDYFLNWMIVNDASIDEKLESDFHSGFRRAGNRFAEMQRIRQFKLGGTAEKLNAITQPVLIQWGENNPQLPVALVEKFTSNLDQAVKVETITYPQTGHVLAVERPKQSAADLHVFLTGIRGE